MSKKDSHFDFKTIEQKLWRFWQEGQWFHAEVDKKKEPFSVIIPPPNVTSKLHIGHGLNNTLQDILVRWKRMQGYNCMWLPGTDHAGIATQMVVEKALARTGQTRESLGRENFFNKCVEWKEENGSLILDQLKRLGCSCDWKREAYTMDPQLSKAVRYVFCKLFEDGLIYRGERLVNWDPVLKTAVSDDEVDNQEVKGHLWHFKYQLEEDSSQFLVVATTRPETMFGDTAVAVHPDDERYKNFIGKNVRIPLTGKSIQVIADDYVKTDFGTGCLKITPAHDPNDFLIGKKHKLSFVTVMNEDGTMNDHCPNFVRNLDRFVARKEVIKRLKEQDLFVEAKPYAHVVPFSNRSKVPIEPRPSKQWFVRMDKLAGPAMQYVEKGELKFYPDVYKKTYFHWLENIQDWCISRQLWWGHQIPIWYCQTCQYVNTGVEDPSSCSSCGSSDLKQDEDVLDTWFSSWLWPLSPFGWPDKTEDLSYFFPSNVLVTGSDIIFLWVARMVMASHYFEQKLPFKDVYFNSMICDKQGRKLSKTLGNGIDPLEVVDQYGADAARYTFVSLSPLGGRIKMDISDFENGSRFIHKIWNASRFLLGYVTEETKEIPDFSSEDLDIPSRSMLYEYEKTVARINRSFDNYQINEAVEALFHFVWKSFCDWSLEVSKTSLKSGEDNSQNPVLSALFYVFEGILRFSSPVMPYLTEEIWHKLPQHPRWPREKSLVISLYPKADNSFSYEKDHKIWQSMQSVITSIRSVRTQAGVPPKVKLPGVIQCDDSFSDKIKSCSRWIKSLAAVDDLSFSEEVKRPKDSLLSTGNGYTVFVPVGQYLDFDKEEKRLSSECQRVQKIVFSLEKKLSNTNFIDRAPQEIVENTKDQLLNMTKQLETLSANLKAIQAK
ncbi:MAG: valine--tRNA ligase [Zetaproteobacteria bacterium]|nr:valine--tRNA ligase [Pseudobdellovibrionaceae bacterium]